MAWLDERTNEAAANTIEVYALKKKLARQKQTEKR